jgi:hypothetical protein
MRQILNGAAAIIVVTGLSAAGPQIVDIPAASAAGTVLTLDAGRYVATPVDMSGGGGYTAWNAWGGDATGCDADGCDCGTGWLLNWRANVAGKTIFGQGSPVCETPEAAFTRARTGCFALDDPAQVTFVVSDNVFTDNLGGVSFILEHEAECPDDCNDNGFSDRFDISSGSSDDSNDNGMPDECESCNAADVALPYDLLDLDDISAFVSAFLSMDPLADLDDDGLFDLDDLAAFINAFVAGCP